MTRSVMPWVVGLVVLVAPSCDVLGLGDDGGTGVRIVALEDAVLAGGMQGIRTENPTSRSVLFNPCPRFFERRMGADWLPLPETRPAGCTDHLEELQARTNSGFLTPVPASLPAGTYRIVFEAFWFGEGVSETGTLILELLPVDVRTTGGFEVVPP